MAGVQNDSSTGERDSSNGQSETDANPETIVPRSRPIEHANGEERCPPKASPGPSADPAPSPIADAPSDHSPNGKAGKSPESGKSPGSDPAQNSDHAASSNERPSDPASSAGRANVPAQPAPGADSDRSVHTPQPPRNSPATVPRDGHDLTNHDQTDVGQQHRVDNVPTRSFPKKSTASFTPVDSSIKSNDAADSITGTKKFRFIRQLGSGGMGTVYEAEHRVTGERVALKTMKGFSPTAVEQFKNEYRSVSDLIHPNLISRGRLDAEGSLLFFTMELIDGTDFRQFLRPDDNVDPDYEQVRSALCQLAEGLLVLHNSNVLHRDIKPSNVMIDRNGRVVLLDFGLALPPKWQAYPQGHSTRQAVGTFQYMSLEQAACRKLGFATDWYSVGVMLYEVLTGNLPYPHGILPAIFEDGAAEPPPPKKVSPNVPSDLNDLCVELLNRLPDARPDGEEILRRLGHSRSVPLTMPELSTGESNRLFVGRHDQLAELQRAVRDMQRGQTISVFVHGKSGFGKSTLVERFLDDAQQIADVVILKGRCYERESLSFKALDSLVDALCVHLRHLPRLEADALMPRDIGALTRVFPVLGRVEVIADRLKTEKVTPDQQELRRRAFAALRELLTRLGQRHTLIFFIDDLQWSDLDSVTLLTELLRPPDAPLLLMIGCYRDEEADSNPCLQYLREAERRDDLHADVRKIAVEALTPDETRELVLRALHLEDDVARTLASVIAKESDGNPFFIRELLLHVHLADAPSAEPPSARLTLEQALWRRIEQLPDKSRRLLELVCVAGHPLNYSVACRAAEVGEEDHAATDNLRSAYLIRTSGTVDDEHIETFHDRVRETVTARLTAEKRRALHLKLAEIMEATHDSDQEELATHFDAGGDPASAAEHYVVAAARAAASLAFERAVSLYRRAIELSSPAYVKEHALLAKLADSLADAGRGREAAEQYLAAADQAVAANALELRRRAATQLLITGHVEDGLTTVQSVLDGVGMKLPKSAASAFHGMLWRRGVLLLRGVRFRRRHASQLSREEKTRLDSCWSIVAGLSCIDTIRGSYFQARYLRLALKSGEPFRIAQAIASEAAHLACPGDDFGKRRGRRLLDAARKLADESSEPYLDGIVLLMDGISQVLYANWREGGELCDRASKIFRSRCTGVTWELDTAYIFSLYALKYCGELNKLRTRRKERFEDARRRGDLYAMINFSTQMLAVTYLADNRPADARNELQQVFAQWSQPGFFVQNLSCLIAQTQVDLYEGRGEQAFQQICACYPALRKSLVMRIRWQRILYWYQRAVSGIAAFQAGGRRDQQYLRDAADCAKRLERERQPWPRALAKLVNGSLAAAQGDDVRAVELLADCAKSFDLLQMSLVAASVRIRLSELDTAARSTDLDQDLEQATAWMARQHVLDPEKMARIYVP